MATDAEAVFFARFPLKRFPLTNVKRNLAVGGLSGGIHAHSSHTSPLNQTSPEYDQDHYNIKMLKGIKMEGKIVCVTIVDIPMIQVHFFDVFDSFVRFGAIVDDTANDSITLIEYGQIELVALPPTAKSVGIVSIPVTLHSNLKSVKSFNTNKFVFFSYSGANMVMSDKPVTINAWIHERRLKMKRPAEQPTQAQQIYDSILSQLPAFKDNVGVLSHISSVMQSYSHNNTNNIIDDRPLPDLFPISFNMFEGIDEDPFN